MSKPIKRTDENKAWNKRLHTSKRILGSRPIVNHFEIYCEGANTEPEYFKSFPVNPITRVVTEGCGRQRCSLVRLAISEWRKKGYLVDQKNYSSTRQLWVVFDYDWRGDEHECQDFINALQIAESSDVKCAFSNDSFELWLLLHFQTLNAKTHRSVLSEKLTAHLGVNYTVEGKKKDFTKKLYKLLKPLQESAIRNAEQLVISHGELSSRSENPLTHVHKLVEQLNRFIRK